MKKTILFYLLLLAYTTSVYAQFPKPTYTKYPDGYKASEFIKRPLLIEIKEIDSKQREKLEAQEPEFLKFKDSYNEYCQTSLKDYFEKNYSGSKDIRIKTTVEINQILASGSNEFAIIRAGTMKRSYDMSGRTVSEYAYTFQYLLSEDKNELMGLSFLSDMLTDPDFLFVVQQTNFILNEAINGKECPPQGVMLKEYAAKANGKTLIVSENSLDEKLTKEAILEVYKQPIQFISNDIAYDSLIVSKSKDIIYITSIFSPTAMGVNYLIVSAETGEVLLNLNAGGLTVSIGTKPSKDQMERMAQPSSEYNRNRYYIEFVKFKPKYSFKKNHYAILNSYSKIKEEKKK